MTNCDVCMQVFVLVVAGPKPVYSFCYANAVNTETSLATTSKSDSSAPVE